jgi:alanine transaminase
MLPETMNKNLMDMEYAVRGKLVIKAGEYQKQLDEQPGSLPFDEVILCNIGNPQSVGQKPLTFYRQVLAGMMWPDLVDSGTLPPDVAARCKKILGGMTGGVGAYSGSKGVDVIRESVANYILERDGHPADVEHIFLTSGASEGIKTIMSLVCRGEQDGFLIPIPQYPLYSATVTAIGGTQLGYELVEQTGWKCVQTPCLGGQAGVGWDGARW